MFSTPHIPVKCYCRPEVRRNLLHSCCLTDSPGHFIEIRLVQTWQK